MYTLPSVVLSLVVASLIGLGFFLLFGRGWLRLVIYWAVAVLGFFIGQTITMLLGFSLLPIGSVNILEASIASIVALLITRAVWKS